MPGGRYDSSKTRVTPVFNGLVPSQDVEWPRALLLLADGGWATLPAPLDYTFVAGYWGAAELGLRPPVSLLSWLIRNVQARSDESDTRRQRLFDRDPKTLQTALEA